MMNREQTVEKMKHKLDYWNSELDDAGEKS